MPQIGQATGAPPSMSMVTTPTVGTVGAVLLALTRSLRRMPGQRFSTPDLARPDVENNGGVLCTKRLTLRRWRDEDREHFAALNADPAVMEHFVAPLTREQSDDFVDRIEAHFDDHGWGLWAVEVNETGAFAGYVGLSRPNWQPSLVEVGWRLARDTWGRGYATEAAQAAVDDGFDRLGFDEIVSFTAVDNVRSQRVMQKIGMQRNPADDFDHPNVPAGHHLRRHVLYRLKRH